LTPAGNKKPSKEVVKPQKLKSIVHIPKPVALNKEKRLKDFERQKTSKTDFGPKKTKLHCLSGSCSNAISSSNATGFF
jgi:hypothetical protein